MRRGFDIPWIGGSKYYVERGVNIPWVRGSVFHVYGVKMPWVA
jgi:hypothetical protein